MKAQQKKLSGCASNSLAHEDLGNFEEAHHWNIQAKFYNEKFPLVYGSDKKDSNIAPSLFFSHFLFGPSFFFFFFWASFFCLESHPDLWGNHSLHHPFLTWDNALIMMIITLLFTYNSRIAIQYLEQNMTLCECLRRCTGICNESRVTCMKDL